MKLSLSCPGAGPSILDWLLLQLAASSSSPLHTHFGLATAAKQQCFDCDQDDESNHHDNHPRPCPESGLVCMFPPRGLCTWNLKFGSSYKLHRKLPLSCQPMGHAMFGVKSGGLHEPPGHKAAHFQQGVGEKQSKVRAMQCNRTRQN